MASVNRVILIGTLGRDNVYGRDLTEENRHAFNTYKNALQRFAGYFLRRRLEQHGLGLDAVLAELSNGCAEVAQSYRDVCRQLAAALRALRKAGVALVAARNDRIPRSWEYAGSAAFFHSRKVDGRNLP